MPHFDELHTIEQMTIDTLQQNGWMYIKAADLPRTYDSVLVEPMLRDALVRLNPCIAEEPSRADQVIYRLRSLILSARPGNLIAQNEIFKQFIFERNTFPFGKNGKAVPVRFFAMEPDELQENTYVVTDQWIYPAKDGGAKFDLVLLVNGIPLVIGEFKTPVRAAITWLDGAKDMDDYEHARPAMFVTNVFVFATEGKCYRYGSIGLPINLWNPWHTPNHKKEGTLQDVRASMRSMLTPAKLLDIFHFFTLFATNKRHEKIKLICRYQQYEAANAIVARVRAGHPKQGLIWHFQGSGKSLLMVFAALKLRMMEDLQNPTVVIIDDRLDLETQITATFQTTDIPNLASLSTKEDVERFFEQDTRKIAITTIFRFGDVDHVLNERSNIILMVDEAHRTQEGDLGARMRLALPNAFFFGLTGTPINKLDHNTFKTFGSTEDPSGYMSKYSFADSIRDHATLPLRFEPVPVELHIDKEKLESEFDALTEGLTDDQRAELSRRVNMKAIMYNRERIRKVCEHIVRHFQTKVAPNGYKGQIVVYDRECCLMYKEELDRLLPPEASTIVMDTNNDKAGRYKKYARSRDEEGKLLDTFREKTSPLKLVIVTSKLLTGFDAPILQCMYLDKPMKDHTLLQAICRVNRVYDEGKALGLVVDYIGIFDDAAKALSFDDASMKKVIENIEGIKQQLPILLAKCLSYFNGVDRTKEGWEGLIEAQEKLPDNETKDKFAADYGVLNKAWNILSPDPVLAPYRDDYLWLSRVYESVKPMDQSGALIWASLGPKTMQLIDENIEVGDADETIEAITMDPEMIERFIAQPNSEKAAKKIEIQLIAILRKKHSKKYQEIGEKLERLREQHEQRLINSVEFLRQLLELAREAARAEQEVVPKEEQDKGKAALTELFNGIRTEHTPVMVERIVNDIDGIVKLVRFDGWQNTATGQKEVQRALRKIVWQKYSIKDQDVFEKAYRYIEEYY